MHTYFSVMPTSSTLLAQALLENEQPESFAWAFGIFRSILEHDPTAWLMDADPSAAIAARDAFPTTMQLR
jgi:hypothetical protein